MKKIALLFLASIYLISFFSCQKKQFQGPDLDLNADVKIKSFTSGSSSAIINDTTNMITLVTPFGQSRNSLTPVITIANGATVTPASGVTVDLTKPVVYQVVNGNLFNKYTVTSSEEKAILSFVVKGVSAEIDNTARTITAIVPSGTNLAALAPVITLASGASITPASGTANDFTNPVVYKVTKGTASINYTVTITTPQKVAFLSTAASINDLTNPDELAAWNWLKNDNPEAQFISFNGIKSGATDISSFTVIWWHEDNTQDLPAIAFDATVLNALKNYYNNGGSFLLTCFGARYVEALGIVPAGKGPNNSFGDPRGNQWIEATWSWGISFKGHESHPAFAGLTLTTDKPFATAYLLANGTYRLNHTAQWFVPDWGGYGTPANWRSQTGGIDLGSTEWDENHNTVITMAEFPRTVSHGAAITISAGCYDWYSEASPSNASDQPSNGYLINTQKMTHNSLSYLSK